MAGRPLRRTKNPESVAATLNRLGSKAIGMYLYEPRTGENWVVAKWGSFIAVRNTATGEVTRDVSGLVFTKPNPSFVKMRKNYGAGRRMTAEDGVPPWAVGMDAEWYEMHYAPKKPQSVEDARKKLIGPKLTKKQQAEMDAEYAGEARHAKRYRNPSPDRALEVLAKEHGYKLVKANPAGWMHDESSRAVRRAIATRSPDDIRRARALQVRNEKARSKERMRLPNPKKNSTCSCGCGGKCGKKKGRR